jgi:flagellar biogenesis protein FliO
MPDVTQPVPFYFIIETIGFIFALVAIGIYGVKRGKEKREI